MRFSSVLILFSLLEIVPTVTSFVPHIHKSQHPSTTWSRRPAALSPGDQVLLVGPGFLQLVLAKTCKAAGLTPIIVTPTAKMEAFQSLVKDDSIMMTIGMPEEGEETFGTLAAVVFCAEDAVLPAGIVDRVLSYPSEAFVPGGLQKIVCCVPMSNKIQSEKSMGWMPIFNNDNKNDKMWDDFLKAYQQHPLSKTANASLVRFGSLLGGSVDGPECLREVGIDEKMYKVRSFVFSFVLLYSIALDC